MVTVLVDGTPVCTTQANADGTFSCTATTPLPRGDHQVTVQADGHESGVTTITVVIRSLSGGGLGVGCASTGGTPGPWLLALVAVALLLRRRRTAMVATVLVASAAFAQTSTVPSFELERVRLTGGAQHGLLVESADLLPKEQFRIAVTFHYEQDPLVVLEDGKRVGSVVRDRIGLHLSGAYSFTDWLDASVQLPIILSQAGSDLSSHGYAPIFTGAAAGTPWLGVRGALFQERRGHPLDVSIGASLGIPLGSAGALAKDDSVSVIPSIGVGRTLTSFLRVGGSVSALLRNARTLTQQSTTTDQVGSLFNVGLILSTLGDGLRGELSARLDVPFTLAPAGAEVDLGLRYPLIDLLELYAVGGPGFGGLPGTPSFRVLAGVAIAPRPKKVVAPVCVAGQPHDPVRCPELDLDGDGIANAKDECPTVPGIAARKGCPDIDTDKDGVLDADDACPTVPGPIARKGCPEPDTDKDGVPDSLDACPTVPGPAAQKGCPDTDGDGLTDDVDACPKEAGIAELKGCPDPDTDGDGVPDRFDACKTVKGVKENNGCPPEQQQLVVITRDRLIIKDKVYFATGKSTILPRSFPLLEQVSKILKEHTEVERVSIEGHTDGRGNRATNLKLSDARAASVKQWLLKSGIADARMTSKGFGPDKPVGSNDTEAGREQNRRVEFVIVGAETTTTSPAPAK
jgi:MYXO-CTERM domain-containing protein